MRPEVCHLMDGKNSRFWEVVGGGEKLIQAWEAAY